MAGFTVKNMGLDPLGILPIVKLGRGKEGVLETQLGVFQLTEIISSRMERVVKGSTRRGDCHNFAWLMGTGNPYRDEGPPKEALLEEHGLEEIGIVKLEEKIHTMGFEDFKKHMASGGDTDSIAPPVYEGICNVTFTKGERFEQGDLWIKRYPNHITHSMIYIGNHDKEGPIFISKIGEGGKISIHTLGEIMTYYKPGTYSVYRESSSAVDNKNHRYKFSLPKGSYKRSSHYFDN